MIYTIAFFIIIIAVLTFFLHRCQLSMESYVNVQIKKKLNTIRDFLGNEFTITDQEDFVIHYNIAGVDWNLTVAKDDFKYVAFREDESGDIAEVYSSFTTKHIRWFLQNVAGRGTEVV